ncbi:tetratricopeptide repeat protein [Boseongicola sp. H5]|uniref:tetratricopeptide repeat protein n=1 Tax=Rhodobacterales TaxID=204455 RepID=UPI001B10ED59|nr:tetratricopeptide repeat protein [Boseongicola sp. H5]MBO6602744.1 tetratricopeptide repeat protein [Roseicyclus sp.]MBO6623975.1 tetratricopeptide repeat protein [Roseicyclus sp.]MBO6923016.1 tetratricopeptide repeat protein [Roseicyclus sp.]
MRLAALPLVALLGLGLILPLPAAAQNQLGLAGSYLAARQAVIDGDHREAALYFERAMQRDPGNRGLIGNALLARAALGQWDRAMEVAARLPDDDPGRELAWMVEQVTRVRLGNLSGALEAIEAGRGAGPLIDGLTAGWLHLGEGDMRLAEAAFEDMAADGPLAGLAQYHLALARAAVGDFEGAEAIMSGETYGPQQATARGLRAHAQVLVQLDRHEDALELLDMAILNAPDPVLIGLRDAIAADPTRPYDFLVRAEQGVAEVFYSVATGLGDEGGPTLPLIYARAAHVIDDGHYDALLLAAEWLMRDEQAHLAADVYAEVPEDHPAAIAATLGRAEALNAMDRQEEAVALLQALTEDRPELASVQAALGDMLRRMERFGEAAAAYDAALAQVDQDQTRYWFLFYARGISLEREGRWDEAEADFRRALELNPDQPQVLNYLGYSLVEQRRNLDEALQMIERAVAAEPRSGYIVDSLGWVLYRLERFDEAVAPMERAVELLPNDPIVNDHLGDVYYMVGRTREAEFQWHRALSFEPTEDDAVRIRRKLEIGLTRVLEEEAAESETQ